MTVAFFLSSLLSLSLSLLNHSSLSFHLCPSAHLFFPLNHFPFLAHPFLLHSFSLPFSQFSHLSPLISIHSLIEFVWLFSLNTRPSLPWTNNNSYLLISSSLPLTFKHPSPLPPFLDWHSSIRSSVQGERQRFSFHPSWVPISPSLRLTPNSTHLFPLCTHSLSSPFPLLIFTLVSIMKSLLEE